MNWVEFFFFFPLIQFERKLCLYVRTKHRLEVDEGGVVIIHKGWLVFLVFFFCLKCKVWLVEKEEKSKNFESYIWIATEAFWMAFLFQEFSKKNDWKFSLKTNFHKEVRHCVYISCLILPPVFILLMRLNLHCWPPTYPLWVEALGIAELSSL